MSATHAVLGLAPKHDKKNKIYYCNRKNYGFSMKSLGENGKPIARTHQGTGMQLTDGMGAPIYQEFSVMFEPWVVKFTDLGYWCIYEVTADTPKYVADELKKKAEATDNEIMNEKAFIEFSNPTLAQHMAETADLEAEKQMLQEDVEKAKAEKNTLEAEITKLKKKAGIT